MYRHSPQDETSSLAAIDRLIAAFFGAFDNRDGREPAFGTFSDLFAPGATISMRQSEALHTWSLQQFWQPRAELLDGGDLTNFHEWEVTSETNIFGALANRRSTYQKEGQLGESPYHGTGSKLFHLVLFNGRWRIVHVLWEDGDQLCA